MWMSHILFNQSGSQQGHLAPFTGAFEKGSLPCAETLV